MLLRTALEAKILTNPVTPLTLPRPISSTWWLGRIIVESSLDTISDLQLAATEASRSLQFL